MPNLSLVWPRLLTGLRWLYGLLFLLIGAHALLASAGFLPKGEYPSSPESEAFTQALFGSGFVGPLMSVTYFISGLLIIIKRTTPLGLVLLAPFVVGIFFTNIMLNGSLPAAFTITGLWLLLAWHVRSAYRPMWNFNNPPSEMS